VSGTLEGLPLKEAINALAVILPGDNDGLPDRDRLEAYMKDSLSRLQQNRKVKKTLLFSLLLCFVLT